MLDHVYNATSHAGLSRVVFNKCLNVLYGIVSLRLHVSHQQPERVEKDVVVRRLGEKLLDEVKALLLPENGLDVLVIVAHVDERHDRHRGELGSELLRAASDTHQQLDHVDELNFLGQVLWVLITLLSGRPEELDDHAAARLLDKVLRRLLEHGAE